MKNGVKNKQTAGYNGKLTVSGKHKKEEFSFKNNFRQLWSNLEPFCDHRKIMTGKSIFQVLVTLSLVKCSDKLECHTYTLKSFKVHIFWEGHKILPNLHCRFDGYYIGQIRFRKNLWPSQNVWTLDHTNHRRSIKA